MSIISSANFLALRARPAVVSWLANIVSKASTAVLTSPAQRAEICDKAQSARAVLLHELLHLYAVARLHAYVLLATDIAATCHTCYAL